VRGDVALPEVWNGTISFSLVAIPVKLVTALAHPIAFRLLHKKDNAPLARRMYCPKEGTIVSADEIVRGYEVAPGKYVTVTDKELESLSPERSRTIEIVEFVDLADVPPVYYGRPYYLVPGPGGKKAYRLLVEVLRQTHKAGLAKFVLREREYVVAVKSGKGALSLITLHYRGEILGNEDILPKDETLEPETKRHILKAIRAMTADFRPARYADARRKKVAQLLTRKARDQGTVEAPETENEEEAGVVDLMAALEESMSKIRERRG
jgi:DNA end-binding protein Ku